MRRGPVLGGSSFGADEVMVSIRKCDERPEVDLLRGRVPALNQGRRAEVGQASLRHLTFAYQKDITKTKLLELEVHVWEYIYCNGS